MSATMLQFSPPAALMVAAGVALGFATPALAMSPPSTSQQTNTGTATATPPPTCLKKRHCVGPKAEEMRGPENRQGTGSAQLLLEQGWRLARTGHCQLAIDLFMLMRDRSNSSALNGLGYANRKLGRFDIEIRSRPRSPSIRTNSWRANIWARVMLPPAGSTWHERSSTRSSSAEASCAKAISASTGPLETPPGGSNKLQRRLRTATASTWAVHLNWSTGVTSSTL